MTVLKSDLIATLDLIDKAQRLVAKLEQGIDEVHHCDECRNDAIDIKILLDGAYTRLREDVLGWEKEVY